MILSPDLNVEIDHTSNKVDDFGKIFDFTILKKLRS